MKFLIKSSLSILLLIGIGIAYHSYTLPNNDFYGYWKCDRTVILLKISKTIFGPQISTIDTSDKNTQIDITNIRYAKDSISFRSRCLLNDFTVNCSLSIRDRNTLTEIGSGDIEYLVSLQRINYEE